MSEPIRVLIMGAAGRDFHNFNVCFRRLHYELRERGGQTLEQLLEPIVPGVRR